MRSLRILAVLSVCAVVPLACTSLLGDYTIGSAGPTNDSGNDGVATDGMVPTEAGPDSGPDANALRLACTEVGGERMVLGTFPNSAGQADQVFVLSLGPSSGFLRALVPYAGGTHVYTFKPGDPSMTTQTSGPPGQVHAVKHYPGSPGGIAMLIEGRSAADGGAFLDSGASVSALQVTKLADDSTTWSVPVNVTAPGDLNCSSRLVATFEILDAGSDDYLVAYSYTNNGNAGCTPPGTSVFGRHAKGSNGATHSWPLPPLDAGGNGVDFLSDGFALVGSDVYVMANASGGPTSGGPTLFKTDHDMATASTSASGFVLKSPSDSLFGQALHTGQVAGKANVGFFEVDVIGGGGSLPTFYVGQVAGSALPTLAPSALAGTVFAGVSDVPVDKSSFHWDDFSPTNENLLGIARSLDTTINGANFVWVDAQGRVRAKQTGDHALLAGEKLYATDIVFSDVPLSILANLQLVFVKNEVDGGTGPFDVIATHISCR